LRKALELSLKDSKPAVIFFSFFYFFIFIFFCLLILTSLF